MNRPADVLSFQRWTLGYVGALMLFVVYGLVIVANARIPRTSSVARWSGIGTPVVLAAVVLLPVLDAEFSFGSLRPIIFAAGVLSVGAAVALAAGSRSAD